MSPLDFEDATPGDNPARALTRKEISGAQQKEAELMQPPKPAAAQPPPGQAGRPQDLPIGGGTEAPQQSDASAAGGRGAGRAKPGGEQQSLDQLQNDVPVVSGVAKIGSALAKGATQGLLMNPQQSEYIKEVAKNPWFPAINAAELGPEALWNIAHHVGAGWNALTDPNAQSVSQHAIWSRNDALAKLVQLAEGGPAGQFNHGQSEWFWENFGSMITSAPAYANPLSGTALFALSLAGSGPDNLNAVPGAIKSGLPTEEIGTLAQHPEEIKDPKLAARLFWKSANAALIGLSVLPMTSWLKGLKILDPKRLEELTQTAEKLKAMQPGDPSVMPDGRALMEALQLPPMADASLVAKGATRNIRQMEQLPGGEYVDLTSKQRAKIYKALGAGSDADLPHVAPNWTPAQVKLASKVMPQYLPYDLMRIHSGDVVPENPRLFLDQVGEAGPEAMRYLATFEHVHLQALRGPTLDPLNAGESMVHSIPAMQEGTRYITTRLAAARAALMEKAGVNGKDLMRALRNPDAYEKLSPAGKLILNSEKVLTRVIAKQSRDFGFREGVVPNYDPRVKVQEEAPIPGGGQGRGKAVLTSESKAHRQEQFIVHPDNPGQIALTEKHPDVFSLNAEMKQLREAHIAENTKTAGIQNLENKAADANARGDWLTAHRALAEIERRETQGLAQAKPEAIAAATQAAIRRYPLYHEDLHEALTRSLPRQIMALHSHIALGQVTNALAHDGNPLAFERGAREIPPGYKKLTNAASVFDNYVFHPDFADPLNRMSQSEGTGAYSAIAKLSALAVQTLMISPMIHADNIVGRAAWLLGKNPIKASEQGAAAMAHSKPWAMLEQMFGVKHGTEEDRLKWQLGMEMQAIDAGIIPHYPSQGLSNLLFSQYGKAIGDDKAFESPGTRENWRLPPAFQGIEGAARMVGHGYDWLQNLLWGRFVAPFGVVAFHIERAAIKAANPNLSDLVIDQMAAHMGNRWQGAIEPMARSQAMNTLWKTGGFAINWVRSFYELALPSYLSKSAVAAHPELRGYILRQELQSLTGMMMAQHLSGNLMNMLLSGHPQWENDPHNRYYLEITRPDVIRGLQARGLYKNIDAATGRDPQTGGKLVIENPLARQQLQMERMLGMEPGTSQKQGAQDFAAGHISPLVDSAAAAFNVNLPQSILSGTPRYMDGHATWEAPWDSNFWATLAQFSGTSGTIGHQVQLDAAGRPVDQSTMPDWLKNSPVPDVIKRYAAPGAQQAWNWMTGIRAPYVRVDKTEGAPIPDQNYAAFAQLSDSYKKDMSNWSDQLTQGKMTPYEWRQQYSARAHDYAVRLDQLFNGAPEYKQGALGLYSGYQKLYNDAQLPDGTGVDWGKLDGLQADFTQNLTASQRADLQSEISKHENAYPALGMYRSTIDAHVQMAKDYAQTNGVSYGTLMTELQASRGMDKVGYRQYLGQHPEIRAYEQAQTEWEINTWPGRLYSLYYHTSAMARWLIPAEGGTGPAAEEAGLQQVEQHYHAPVAAG